jgi:hypothetical protein
MMYNVLRIKNFMLAGMVGASALFCSKDAIAESVNWSSFSQIISRASGQSSVYTSANSSVLQNRLTAICYVSDGGVLNPIGGFDLINGVVTLGYFNEDWNSVNGYGLNLGDTANTGSNSSNNPTTLPIIYEVFYDSDGDGSYESEYDGFIANRTEQLNPSQYTISGFSPFNLNGLGTFNFTYRSAASASTLTTLGMVPLGGGTNQVTLSVAVSNAISFSIEYKTTLTNATWESLGNYRKTGEVTVITDTNHVPQRFYRAVTP